MAAVVEAHVFTGSGAATESGAVTGIDLISADNATNSLANRQANPIATGTRSYEKWVKLAVTTPPANEITNVQIWGDGAIMASTTLWFTAGYITGATPTSDPSTVADQEWIDYTSGNKALWDAGPLTVTDALTEYAVWQLEVGSDHGPGAWTQEVATYTWDET